MKCPAPGLVRFSLGMLPLHVRFIEEAGIVADELLEVTERVDFATRILQQPFFRCDVTVSGLEFRIFEG